MPTTSRPPCLQIKVARLRLLYGTISALLCCLRGLNQRDPDSSRLFKCSLTEFCRLLPVVSNLDASCSRSSLAPIYESTAKSVLTAKNTGKVSRNLIKIKKNSLYQGRYAADPPTRLENRSGKKQGGTGITLPLRQTGFSRRLMESARHAESVPRNLPSIRGLPVAFCTSKGDFGRIAGTPPGRQPRPGNVA